MKPAAGSTDDVLGRIAELDRRLRAVEERVGQAPGTMGPAASPHPAYRDEPIPVVPLEAGGAVPDADAPARPASVPPPLPGKRAIAHSVMHRPPAPDNQPAPHVAGTGTTWEQTIGQNWTSWVGALVVVLGVMFFLKYAWDQGWLAMPPMARVMTSLLGGVAMIGAGFFFHHRAMRVLAATLNGAGVAVMMAAMFASNALFNPPVFARPVAFAGVAVVAALAILLALRINAMTVAIVGLLGAYLSPAILSSGRDQSLAFILYLGTLGVVGWSLAYFKPRWPGLRWFLFACNLLWMALWMLEYGRRAEHRSLALAAITFFFAGFLGEMYASLHRAFRIRKGEEEQEFPTIPTYAARLDASLGTLSILSTAAAFGGFYIVLERVARASSHWLAVRPVAGIAVGLACLHAIIALATPAKLFTRSSLLQAAALITLAIPLAFAEQAITIAWLLLATTLAALSWRTRNGSARLWALVLLGLGLARLCTLDALDTGMTQTWFTLGDEPVSRWLLMACAVAVLFHGIGWMMIMRSPAAEDDRPGPQSPPPSFSPPGGRSVPPLSSSTIIGIILTAIGTLLFAVAMGTHWHGAALTFVGVAWVAALLGLAKPGQALQYPAHAAIALVVVCIKWLLVDGLWPIMEIHGTGGLIGAPLVNMAFLNGVLLMCLLAWLGWAGRSDLQATAIVAGAIVGFAILNFETLRAMDGLKTAFADPATAKQVAISILWGVVGVAGIIVGFARNWPALRYVALGLLGVTLLKIFLVDMAEVRAVYRILSFLGVGVALLCVSYVYHRQIGGLSRREPG